MKYLSLILILFVFSCKEENRKRYVDWIICGNDTIVFEHYGGSNMDVSKSRGNSGHNDTVNKIFITKFTRSFPDTVLVHDTIWIGDGGVKNRREKKEIYSVDTLGEIRIPLMDSIVK